MNILQSLILGVVEGLTEFLPVSSTFHLIMASRLLQLESSEFLKLFEVIIQSGAIMALLFIYTKRLLSDRKLILNVLYSFIPTAIVGFALHRIIKTIFFEADLLMFSVFIGMGVLFLLLEKYFKTRPNSLNRDVSSLTVQQSIIIGLAQASSVIPGVSRAGSVIVAMMCLGYKRAEAAKYTFLLSLPTIFAASALDLYQGRELLMGMADSVLLLSVGFLTAFAVAYGVVKWLTHYLASNTLEIFGWYRIGASLLLLVTMAIF